MKKTFKIIRKILFYIIIITIVILAVLYAREGRLSIDTIKGDYENALKLKETRKEEEENYNAVSYQTLISKLKNKGLVVGDVSELGTNTLGAKVAVKFTVEGKEIYFFNIDWDDDSNDDTNKLIRETKEFFDERGEVCINGKWYEATVNDTALITHYEDNDAKDIIVKEFSSIVGISYDEYAKQRDAGTNPIGDKVDEIYSAIYE